MIWGYAHDSGNLQIYLKNAWLWNQEDVEKSPLDGKKTAFFMGKSSFIEGNITSLVGKMEMFDGKIRIWMEIDNCWCKNECFDENQPCLFEWVWWKQSQCWIGKKLFLMGKCTFLMEKLLFCVGTSQCLMGTLTLLMGNTGHFTWIRCNNFDTNIYDLTVKHRKKTWTFEEATIFGCSIKHGGHSDFVTLAVQKSQLKTAANFWWPSPAGWPHNNSWNVPQSPSYVGKYTSTMEHLGIVIFNKWDYWYH